MQQTVGVGQNYFDALDGVCPLERSISITRSPEQAVQSIVDEVAEAFKSRFQSSRLTGWRFIPFDAARIVKGEWSDFGSVLLTDRNGDNRHQITFRITSCNVPHQDPEHQEPLEGRSGFEIKVSVQRL